jgi:muramoyltetrapeptide carboxypeptidase
MNVFLPNPIGPPATLGLVSPASCCDEPTLTKAREALHGLGFRTKLFPHTLDDYHGYAGTDEDRASDLTTAFLDPEVDGVLCVRGGYGCARILPYLNLPTLARTRKPFLGYSDITALHLALHQNGLVTFHSPVLTTFADGIPDWSIDSFRNSLSGNFNAPTVATKGRTVCGGVASGTVEGGCLTLLTDSLGTPNEFNGNGKIVLIEDVNERPHRIDAMLTHLIEAGALEGVKGFVVGEMTGTNEHVGSGGLSWEAIVEERLSRFNVPMIFGYPFGHVKAMLTIPMGCFATLNANEGTLTFVAGEGQSE